MTAEAPDKEWDVFISYASEDKEELARPLASLLDRLGLKVWFDEATLQVGDSLARAISVGLARSRYGVVIISSSFMTKKWPRNELAGLLSLEQTDYPVILPVWHGVQAPDVAAFNPILADRVALHSSRGIRAIANAIYERVAGSLPYGANDALSGYWLGETGRLLLRHAASGVSGDYDWFGQPWIGSLAGTFAEGVLRYDWTWALNERRGGGFFLYYAESAVTFRLSGVWWYDSDVSDVDDLISDWRTFLSGGPFPLGFQRTLGLCRWEFTREMRGDQR